MQVVFTKRERDIRRATSCKLLSLIGRVEFKWGPVPDPTPKPDQLMSSGLVPAVSVGRTCTSPMANFPPRPTRSCPVMKFAGEVVAIGSNIRSTGTNATSITVGSRIAVDPSLYCGQCVFCHTGHGNLLNWNAIGDTVSGGFAEYVAVPLANAYPLPDHVTFREAALIEPVACAVHGIHRLEPRLGDSMVIVGAGTMGLLLLQLALRGGASRVAMMDLNTQRLVLARKLGAYHTATSIEELLAVEPLGFDCVIDATGVGQGHRISLQSSQT